MSIDSSNAPSLVSASRNAVAKLRKLRVRGLWCDFVHRHPLQLMLRVAEVFAGGAIHANDSVRVRREKPHRFHTHFDRGAVAELDEFCRSWLARLQNERFRKAQEICSLVHGF
jgi:hypothetical protein